MYYLFISNKDELNNFKEEFVRVRHNIDAGKTPVFNEMRSAKTGLVETIPYLSLSGIFLILSTLLLDSIHINETVKLAIILIVNGICNSIACYVFTVIKHKLRIKLLSRMDLEPTERNIAVLESLEYQSV